MSDDLVKRLRAYEGKGFETTACYNGTRSEAADRIEELEAKLAKAVGVKPLEWRRDSMKGSYPARLRAEMPCKGGDYSVAGSERENLWQWFRNGHFADGHQLHKAMPLEAAKAAAQADYEGRILAALTLAELKGQDDE